jgi:hypothetical protein
LDDGYLVEPYIFITLLVDDASGLQSLLDRLRGDGVTADLQREPLETQLPPRESIVIDFIGRDGERKELLEWIMDPVAKRWALAGDGGKGKSALAYNFAAHIRNEAPAPFQAVFWFSAKKRKFVEGTVVDIGSPDFEDLPSALDAVLRAYGWVEEIDRPTNSKAQRVLELLSAFPALLVIDDIDSLESKDEDVIEFFSLQVPRTASKVLFTSRRTIFGMGGWQHYARARLRAGRRR